eukprot:g12309.t2
MLKTALSLLLCSAERSFLERSQLDLQQAVTDEITLKEVTGGTVDGETQDAEKEGDRQADSDVQKILNEVSKSTGSEEVASSESQEEDNGNTNPKEVGSPEPIEANDKASVKEVQAHQMPPEAARPVDRRGLRYARFRAKQEKDLEEVNDFPAMVKMLEDRAQNTPPWPPSVQRSIDTWRKQNPEWQIQVLTPSTLREALDDEALDFVASPAALAMRRLGATHFSDLVRVEVLAQHGGLWLDATVALTQPVNTWIGRDNRGEECLEGFDLDFEQLEAKSVNLRRSANWTEHFVRGRLALRSGDPEAERMPETWAFAVQPKCFVAMAWREAQRRLVRDPRGYVEALSEASEGLPSSYRKWKALLEKINQGHRNFTQLLNLFRKAVKSSHMKKARISVWLSAAERVRHLYALSQNSVKFRA